MTTAEHDVIIVGAGIAGLGCAHRLAARGLDVEVLERDQVPGGNIRTEELEGFRLERGPHSFLGSADAVFELVDEADLADDLATPRVNARYIARGGRLHEAPSGPLSFLSTSLLSARSKWTLMTEPFRRSRGEPDDTATVFFERRFGPEAAQVLAGAFISGVYAGDPGQLSAPAAFPLFWGFEQETGSMVRGALRHKKRRKRELAARGLEPRRGLFSFTKGLGQLTQALADPLGDRCRLGVEAKTIEREDDGVWVVTDVDGGTHRGRAVVVATPPRSASKLLWSIDPELSGEISEVPMAPVAVVSLGYQQRAVEVPDAFGFLAPRGEGVRTLGVLFPSRLFEGRAPVGGELLVGYVGGTTDPEALELADDELAAIVRGDLEALTGFGGEPVLVRVQRYPQAIPQLVRGHLERMERVGGLAAALPGLALAGNYLSGVGMKDAAASGLLAAEAVVDSLGAD